MIGGKPDRRTSRLERMEALAHAEGGNGKGARPKPHMGGKGAAGTQLFAGYITTDEYVPELTWPRSIATYDKMRRSDGMIRATTRALTMPLLSAMWTVKPASEDAADQEMATFIEDGLFHGMTMTWKRTLREALTSLPFGHAVLEKWWEVRDDEQGRARVMPRKLLPIKQRTISRFNVENDGGLRSIHQQQDSHGRFDEIELPIENLLVFVNEQEGADWLGQSVLRPAYKHWWIADQLVRIQAISAERHGVGIPTVELPIEDDDPATLARWETILSNIRVSELGYVVVTGGAKFSIVGMGEGRALDVLPMIQHHNRMTAVSVLAQFLTLGEGEVGSWALSSDQSGLFLMALQSIADEVAAVFNDYLIKPWIDYNFAGVTKYPELTVSNIETRNGDKLLTAVADAIAKGAMKWDPELEDALRDGLNLPARPEDDDEDLAPEVPPAGGPGAPGAPQDPGTPIQPTPAAPFRIRGRETKQHAWPPKRALRANEQKASMEALDGAIDQGRARIALAGAPGTDALIRELAEQAARAVTMGDPSAVRGPADPGQVNAIAAAVKAELEQLYAFGAGTVREEIIRQLEDLRRLERDERTTELEAIETARAELAQQYAAIEAARENGTPLEELLRELIEEIRAAAASDRPAT